jgi:hypothetical protein
MNLHAAEILTSWIGTTKLPLNYVNGTVMARPWYETKVGIGQVGQNVRRIEYIRRLLLSAMYVSLCVTMVLLLLLT